MMEALLTGLIGGGGAALVVGIFFWGLRKIIESLEIVLRKLWKRMRNKND